MSFSQFSPSPLLVVPLSLPDQRVWDFNQLSVHLSLSLSLSLRTFHLSVLQSLTGETYASASAVTGYPAVGRPPAASVTSARAAQPALLSSLTFHAVADISILDDPCEVGCCS